MTLVGKLLLMAALSLAVAAVAALGAGLRRRRPALLSAGFGAAYGVGLVSVAAAAVLLVAFLTGDHSFAYVLDNSDPELSFFYRIAGFWAGQQGSFLLWLVLLAVVTAVLAVRGARRGERLDAGAVLVLSAVCAFFAALMVIDAGSDPFVANTDPAAAPAGLNPLLLHPAMVFHPPALFLGYAGFAVPFAFALSAAALRRADATWVERSQRWAIGGWLFLSLGIGLGAWWAYVILSWGGYWGWDPVENTSLIPWLTATALLHAFTLYRRRGALKRWSLTLAVVTFWLTVVATWTTRTGVISSVHAFEARTTLLVVLSAFLLVTATVGAVLMVRARRAFRGDRELDSLLSRDFLFSVVNGGLSAFALAVLFATLVVPLVWDQTVRPGTYEFLARPLGVATVVAIGLCPLLSWGATSPRALRGLLPPVTVAALAVLGLALAGWGSDVRGLIGLGACVFALTAAAYGFARAARRAAGGALLPGLRRALVGRRSRLGGLAAHLGMALAVAGLLGSTVYKLERRVELPAQQGARVTVGDYLLTFQGYREGSGPQGAQRLSAILDVSADGEDGGVIQPHLDYFPASGQTTAGAVIHGDTWQDLFVSPEEYGEDQLVVHVNVFPLIRLVWVGAGLLVAGACVSLWPRRRPVAEPVTATAPRSVA